MPGCSLFFWVSLFAALGATWGLIGLVARIAIARGFDGVRPEIRKQGHYGQVFANKKYLQFTHPWVRA